MRHKGRSGLFTESISRWTADLPCHNCRRATAVDQIHVFVLTFEGYCTSSTAESIAFENGDGGGGEGDNDKVEVETFVDFEHTEGSPLTA